MNARLALTLAALLVTGCGGGGGSSTAPSTPSTPQNKNTAQGSAVIFIPSGSQQTSSRVRYPQFVSPGASSVELSINGGANTNYDVSSGSSLCVTGSGGRSCTLTFGAPAGSDSFVFQIFAGANGTGSMLATATSTQPITAGTPFNFTVALNAVVGVLMANVQPSNNNGNCPNSPPGNEINEGCAGSVTVTFTIEDSTGAAITGTAPYATPITLTTGDPSLTVSPAQITAPGQTATLSYSGATLGSGISNFVSMNMSAGANAGNLSIAVRRSYLYVANYNATFGSTPDGGGNVVVYAFGANGAPTPVRTYSGLSNPVQPLLDSSGDLYVLDNGNYTTHSNPFINVYGPGSTTILRSITLIANDDANNACESMQFSPDGSKLIVVCDDDGTGAYHVFPATGNGTASSLELYSWSEDISSPPEIGLLFDNSGANMYSADAGLNKIDTFTAASLPSLPSTPYQNIVAADSINGGSIWTPGTQPAGLAMDAQGTLYSSITYLNMTAGAPDAGNEVALWKTTSIPCNNCAPTGKITNIGFSSAHGMVGIALDPPGNLYVSNPFTNQIDVIPAAVVTTAASTTVSGPTILHTISTAGSGSTAPTGITVGP